MQETDKSAYLDYRRWLETKTELNWNQQKEYQESRDGADKKKTKKKCVECELFNLFCYV